ncbi:flippase [Parahaliea mediterranea]|uniref:Flippase n=1 Tax=Parahaliea mediterranea TaxID=651086 RepID=A0A939DHX5_9GAMM|nr:flippase [Parahaliea mediterranea]MBN7797787.1 flippase [Parahaliea mediterranea]
MRFQQSRDQLLGNGLRARLVRGGLGSAGLQAVNRLLALGLAMLLARMLGPDGYGVYAYAFAIMSLLLVAGEAGVPTLLMREVAASQGRSEWGLLRGALRRGIQFVAVAGLTVSLIGLLVLFFFSGSLRSEVFYTMALMLLVLPVSALCKTVGHAMRGLHKVVIGQAVDMVVRPLLVLVIVGLMFTVWPAQREPQIAMAAQLLGTLLVLIVASMVLRRFLPEKSRSAVPEFKNRQWIKSALPFALIGGAMIINTQADVLMLGLFVTSEDVGIYRVAAQACILVMFFSRAANSVLAPHFSAMHSQNNYGNLRKLYKKSQALVFVVTLPITLVLVFWGEDLLALLFGQEYRGGGVVVGILALGYMLNVAFGPVGNMLQMIGQESATAKMLWLFSVANVLLNLVLIPLYGTIGAATATAVTLVGYHAALRVILRNAQGI